MKQTKIFQKVTAACLSALLLTGSIGSLPLTESLEANASSTVNNPFIWSDVPDDDIIRVGDTYYMVHTTMFFSPGAPIMKSKDLVSWEMCNYVFDKYADGDVQNLKNGKHDYAHGQWATSLRYHDGMFYVFFGSYGSGKSYIYKTDDIEHGTWTRSELNGMYHDASILFDDDGRNYLVYGGGGEIKIKEFNAEMTDFKWGGLDKTLFKTGLTNLAGEGSHVHKIGDYYYVFIIAWPNGSGRIELCYRSKSLTGNFEGKTVLNSGLGTYGSGVAQGGIVDTPDGKWYALLFQDHGAVGRIPVLVPFKWENDWPVMGVNGKAPITLTVDGDYKGTQMAKDDDFTYDANKLMLEWQWNHNPDNTAWSVTDREGYLRLYNKCVTNNFLFARNTLTMRTEGPACSGVIKLDTKGMKAGDHAGLSAFQFKFGNVGVYVGDDGSKHIYMATNGGDKIDNSSEKIQEQVNMQGDEVYLKADYRFNTVDANFNVSNNIDKANFYYSYDGASWKKIGTELSMPYDLTLFTGYRNGIYSFSTKSTGGYADIDYFDYEREAWNVPIIVDPDENGYFFNNSFESGSESWIGRGGASVSTSNKEAKDGSKSLYCTDRTSSWQGAAVNLSTAAFKPGNAYSFGADVCFTEGSDTNDFKMTLQYEDAEGETQYAEIATGTAKKGEWITLSNGSFTIPKDAHTLQFYIETLEGEDSFYVDNAFGALENVGAVPEEPFQPGDIDENGVVNAIDLALAKQGMLGEFKTKRQQKIADMNEDGKVDAEDMLALQAFLLGKEK